MTQGRNYVDKSTKIKRAKNERRLRRRTIEREVQCNQRKKLGSANKLSKLWEFDTNTVQIGSINVTRIPGLVPKGVKRPLETINVDGSLNQNQWRLVLMNKELRLCG